MNLRDLQYFVVLAKTRHFGEAAKQCFVSQPTLSMQIKKLEEDLGILLFERDNKRVMLTRAGEQLAARAQQILAQVTAMKEMAASFSDPLSGDLRLGAIPTVAPYLLPLVMPEIQQALPKLKVWLIEDKTHRLIDKLQSGEIDAAIMAAPILADFSSQPLYDEPFYFACAAQHPLSAIKTIKLEQLAELPIMLLEEGHCLRDQAIALCQSVKAETRADFTATSLETLKLMVQANMGVTLMPALAARSLTENGLKLIPFDYPAPSRLINLYWRPSTVKGICLQALAALIHASLDTKAIND